MRILVTNDDGIDGAGLHVLARRLTEVADVVVVAPDREYSGASAAIGALNVIHPEVRPAVIDGVGEAWSVSGPPALCVILARLGVFRHHFDLVVAGINPGANTGRAIYHSGTVGAALTARNGDIPGLAVSQAVTGFGVEGQGWGEMLADQRWESAAEVGARVASEMLARPSAEPLVVNVNVPNLDLADITGWKRTAVAAAPPRAMMSAELVPKAGHDDVYDVAMQWGPAVDLPSDSDSGALEDGFVVVSALTRFVDDESADMSAVAAALDGI